VKINEVINEDADNGVPPVQPAQPVAPAPKRPGMMARAAQKLNPFNTAGKQAAAGSAQVQKYSKPYIDKWNQATGMNPALKGNAQALQQYASTFAKDRNNQPMFTPDVPSDMSPGGVSQYISDVVAKVLAGGITGQTAPAAPTTPDQPAAADEKVTGITQQDLAPGVKVINQEPIILQYKGKDFSINDQGQWISMASGKTPHQSFQQFLDQQHQRSLGE
jgi:hypothetical protein